jgi:hypothetical protein
VVVVAAKGLVVVVLDLLFYSGLCSVSLCFGSLSSLSQWVVFYFLGVGQFLFQLCCLSGGGF